MIAQEWIYLGALLNIIGSLTYVVHTIQGKTKPNRVTWFLWALAPLVAYAAMISKGVSPLDGLMTFMVGFGPLLIFLASFVNRKSVWKLTRFDMTCGALSLLGLLLWVLSGDGMMAIVFTIVADGLALLPTLVKAWKEPETESYLVFLNGTISAAITLLALQVYDFQHLAFPIYIFFACLTMFVVVRFKLGRRVGRVAARNKV